MDISGLGTIPEIEEWKVSAEPLISKLNKVEALRLMAGMDRLAKCLDIPLGIYNAIKQKHITVPYTRAKFGEARGEMLNGMWQKNVWD